MSVAILVVGGGGILWAHQAKQAMGAVREPGFTTPDATTPTASPVTTEFQGFYAWELLDRRSGARYGSANHDEINFTESMVKAWLAADFLSRAAASGNQPTQGRMDQLVRMIRDSDDDAAESVYRAGGRDASIQRLISVCGLTDTRVYWAGGARPASRPGTRSGWASVSPTAPRRVRCGQTGC